MRRAGTIHFFRWHGIDVEIHWSWLLVVAWETSNLKQYHSPLFSLIEVLAMFAMVLMHEFGHALACRSVGGQANYIILWPLGGVAFVAPPNRPGAVLWSIAAGPLVNVVLFPLLLALAILAGAHVGHSPYDYHTGTLIDSLFGFSLQPTDVQILACWLVIIDAILLVFNILPIYPLDGGQILRALLWFVLGPVTSLRLAAGIGLVASVLGGIWALTTGDWWLALIALFAAWQSIVGLRMAQRMVAPEA